MSFSDFYASDLSDITSSSEDEELASRAVKRSSVKKPKRDQPPPYTIANPLRPPRSTSYSVRALYGPPFRCPLSSSCSLSSQNKSSMGRSTWIHPIKEVRLSFIFTNVAFHPYRVDVVWPEQKQIGLIDSVFRNYYIPPIIFGEPTVFTRPISSHSDLLESCFNIG
jgi:hypothetical protein